jgi:hypothetical protein
MLKVKYQKDWKQKDLLFQKLIMKTRQNCVKISIYANFYHLFLKQFQLSISKFILKSQLQIRK